MLPLKNKLLSFITGQYLICPFWTALIGAAMNAIGSQSEKKGQEQSQNGQQDQAAQQMMQDMMSAQRSPMVQNQAVATAQSAPQTAPQQTGGFRQFMQNANQNYKQGGLFGSIAGLF
jgi:hypothetical protein